MSPSIAALDVGLSPWPPCRRPLLHSKVLSQKSNQYCFCDCHYFPSLLPSFLSLFFPFLSYYTVDKICFPFIVIAKYWQYSPCSTVQPWVHLTINTLCLPLHHPLLPFPSLHLLVTSLYLWVCIFLYSLLCDILRFCKWYHTVFVFHILLSIIHFMLLQMALFHSFYSWVTFHRSWWLNGKKICLSRRRCRFKT